MSINDSSEHKQWYALQVSPRKETLVSSVLSGKGYECYLPVYRKRSVWSDRVKVTDAPLFGGYVFSRFDAQYRLPVLVTPNVHGIVGAGKRPIAVPDNELEQIRIALRSGMPIEPCDHLQEGDTVRVSRGPLSGLEGLFVRYRGPCRLIVSVATIQRSFAVEMDRSMVEPLPRAYIAGMRLHG